MIKAVSIKAGSRAAMFVFALALSPPAFAQRYVEEAEDRFAEVLAITPHDAIIEARADLRAPPGPILLDNPGNARVLVLGCEQACQHPQLVLRVAGMDPLTAVGSRDEPRRVVLPIPEAYARAVSNLEIEIRLNCDRDHCAHRWGLLARGAPPPPEQRGLRDAITDAQWDGAMDLSPQWRQLPNAGDLRFYYPAQALRAQRPGRAQLQCIVVAGGALQCRVQEEQPEGDGFGAAALKYSTALRVAEQDENAQPTLGRRLTVPIVFQPASAGS